MNNNKNSKNKYRPPITLWFSGLPCSGKTTIAKELEGRLRKKGYSIARLDGDDIRRGLNVDLKFSKEDRKENLRRIAHVAQLFNDKNIIVLASFIAPLEENRKFLRDTIKNFNLIFVKCDIKVCSNRDIKGMYKLAREGKIKNFTGVSAPFEDPKNADIILDTENLSVDCCVDQIIERYF
jgi:adenylyl-sulfate kinase